MNLNNVDAFTDSICDGLTDTLGHVVFVDSDHLMDLLVEDGQDVSLLDQSV